MARLTILAALTAVLVVAVSPTAAASRGDGGGDARVAGVCGRGAESTLRLKADEGRIELRFELEGRARARWRLAFVHERRVAWKGLRTTGRNGSLEVRRTVRDLPGTDTVVVRAVGPRGLTCRAVATLGDR